MAKVAWQSSHRFRIYSDTGPIHWFGLISISFPCFVSMRYESTSADFQSTGSSGHNKLASSQIKATYKSHVTLPHIVTQRVWIVSTWRHGEMDYLLINCSPNWWICLSQCGAGEHDQQPRWCKYIPTKMPDIKSRFQRFSLLSRTPGNLVLSQKRCMNADLWWFLSLRNLSPCGSKIPEFKMRARGIHTWILKYSFTWVSTLRWHVGSVQEPLLLGSNVWESDVKQEGPLTKVCSRHSWWCWGSDHSSFMLCQQKFSIPECIDWWNWSRPIGPLRPPELALIVNSIVLEGHKWLEQFRHVISC